MNDISNQIGAINTNKELIKNAQYGKDVRGALYLIANNLVSIANNLKGDLTTHDTALSAISEVLNGLDVTIKNLASKTTVMHFDDTDTASLTISAGDYMAKLNQNGTVEYYQINNGKIVDAQAIEPIRICVDNGEVAYVPSNTGVINLPLSNLGFSKEHQESDISGFSECGLTNADNDSVDFAIADENGNAILAVQNGHIKTRNFNSYKPDKTEVKILFIGNSLTQDAVCYLPLLLDEITPDVKYTIYDWYNAGMNLSQQYNCFINNTNCRTFGTITNNQNGGWNVKDNSVNMKWVCDNCDFDIVVIQEYSYYSYTDDVEVTNFNNIIDYLKTNYHKPFKVFSFVDAPMRTRTDDYIKAKNYAQLHFKNTMCEGIVNPGTAVVYALENDVLKNLGDNGGLTPDGTHTQEGLPCMLQSYVLALWLFSLLGIPKSIYNSQARMTQELYNNWQTIGSNLGSGVVEGTDEEYLEAQKVAIKAYKFGKKLQLDIINEMTEV